MSRVPEVDDRTARALKEVASRAVWRLGILEWVILGGAVAAAMAAGALTAWMLEDLLNVPFRAGWTAASLLFFLVPAALSLRKTRREERERRGATSHPTQDSDV